MAILADTIKENEIIMKDQIVIVTKLVLREYLWCKFVHNNSMYVHFGYDYYMYIGAQSACLNTIKQIQESGLYVEKFKSPYKA